MISELVQDFSAAVSVVPKGHPRHRTLADIRRALVLGQNALSERPDELISQMWRLDGGTTKEVSRFLADAVSQVETPWIRPLLSSRYSVFGERILTYPSEVVSIAQVGTSCPLVAIAHPNGKLTVERGGDVLQTYWRSSNPPRQLGIVHERDGEVTITALEPSGLISLWRGINTNPAAVFDGPAMGLGAAECFALAYDHVDARSVVAAIHRNGDLVLWSPGTDVPIETIYQGLESSRYKVAMVSGQRCGLCVVWAGSGVFGPVRAWRSKTKRTTDEIDDGGISGFEDVAVLEHSADGLVISAAQVGRIVTRYSDRPERGQIATKIAAMPRSIAMVETADSRLMLAAGSYSGIFLFDPGADRPLVTLPENESDSIDAVYDVGETTITLLSAQRGKGQIRESRGRETALYRVDLAHVHQQDPPWRQLGGPVTGIALASFSYHAWVCTGGWNGAVNIWEIGRTSPVITWTFDSYVEDVAISFDAYNGMMVVAALGNGRFALAREQDRFEARVFALPRGGLVHGIAEVYAVAILGEVYDPLIAIGDEAGQLVLWSVREATVVQIFQHDSPIHSVDICHDHSSNRTLCIAGEEDGRVTLWEKGLATPLDSASLHSRSLAGVAVAVAKDAACDSIITTGAEDGLVTVSALGACSNPSAKEVTGSGVSDVSILAAPGGELIVSTHIDGVVRVRRAQDLSPIATFTADAALTCCDAHSDVIVAGDQGGGIHVLSIPTNR